MAKYIDVEKFKRKLHSHGLMLNNLGRHTESLGILKCLDMLEKMPAADVEPVKRGKWNVIDNLYPYCSACRKISNYYCDGVHEQSKYCPSCGAKMEGATE